MSGREHGHDQTMPHSGQAIATTPRPSDELEVVPGFERENLQGWIPQLATESDIRAVIEKAFDYRGDVTVTRKDSSQVTGYLFDRRIGKTLDDSVVRLIVPSGSERPSIPYSDIAGLAFTGRDTAAGKSYEAWVKKYWEKKAAGETNIGIDAESLD